MPKKLGICINFGGCAKAKAKEQQEAEVTNFICEECGKPLREVRTTSSGDGGKLKKIIIIAVAIILLGGGGAFFAFRDGGSSNEETEITTSGDSETDSPETDSTATDDDGTDGQDFNDPNDLGWAIYDGPMKNGKPHGSGGSLNVKKNYSIDLKDANATKIEVVNGDKIVTTIFKEGKLTYGELHRKNGERKPINIGN